MKTDTTQPVSHVCGHEARRTCALCAGPVKDIKESVTNLLAASLAIRTRLLDIEDDELAIHVGDLVRAIEDTEEALDAA